MPSPIVSSTIQSAVLAASSCIIGQLITAHKSDELVPLLFLTFLPLSILIETQKSFTLDTTQIFQFALFSLLSSPPNFLWYLHLSPCILMIAADN
jgi:protein Mpv17